MHASDEENLMIETIFECTIMQITRLCPVVPKIRRNYIYTIVKFLVIIKTLATSERMGPGRSLSNFQILCEYVA